MGVLGACLTPPPTIMQLGPLCFELNAALKLNQKALCLWSPLRHFSNISRTTGDIKLKLSGLLLLLLLLLRFK